MMEKLHNKIISQVVRLIVFSLGWVGICFANPVLDSISAGNVNVQHNAAVTTVQQDSQQAIINWQSFNIGAQEKTQFMQPNASAVALNRIDPSQGVSQIFGQLSANGRIILVNQAGIFFGPSAIVNVGGIIASTSNISNENFLAGNYIFDQASTQGGAIVNEGVINAADYGLVALIGSSISNSGFIQAKLGNVILASGNKFTFDFSGDQLINFSIDEGTLENGKDFDGNLLKNRVNNSGVIMADGGTVLLAAKSVGNILNHIINTDGVIETKSVSQKNGVIILSGDQQGIVRIAGKVNASGKKAGSKGGKVTITGQYLLLDNGADIDVSGDMGGGEIFIGGNYQGKGPLQNATATVVAENVLLNADSLTEGNGGNIIIWANDFTKVAGMISARGGMLGGDGGFVETSGKNYLDVNHAIVDLRANQGQQGAWLLDPTTIYIALNQANATAAGMATTNTTANTGTGGNPNTFQGSGAGATDSLLLTGTLSSALSLANVVVTTNNTSAAGAGHIYVVDPITWATNNSLTLTTINNNIYINNVISNSTGGSLILNVPLNKTITQGAGGTIEGALALTKQGSGILTLSENNTYSGVTTISQGAIVAAHNNGLGGSSISIASGAELKINGGNTISNNIISLSGIGTTSGALTASGSGTATFSGSIVLGNNATIHMPVSGLIFNINGSTINNNGFLLTLDGTSSTSMFISNAISGSGGIQKSGTSTITLSGNNSYDGVTTISGGTLAVSSNNALGSSTGSTVLTASAKLDFQNVNYATAEPLTINASAGVDISSTGSSTFTGPIVFGSSSTTNINVTGTALTLSGNMSGSPAFFNKIGGGSLTLSGNNSYSGSAIVNGGSLIVASNNALGATSGITSINSGATLSFQNVNYSLAETVQFSSSGTLSATGSSSFPGAISLGPSQIIDIPTGADLTLSGVLSSFTFVKQGDGLLTLSNASNSYPSVTINAGTLSVNSIANNGTNSALGTSSFTLGNGTLKYTGGTTSSNRSFTITSGTTGTIEVSNPSSVLTISGGIFSSTGALVKSGAGTLLLSGSNNNSGSITINEGILRMGLTNLMRSTAIVYLTDTAGAQFDLNGFNQTIGGLSGGGSNGGNISLGSATLTVNQSVDLTYSGAISGSGGLTKQSAGTLTLGGDSSYDGATLINNTSKIIVTHNNALGSSVGGTTILSGGILDFNNVVYSTLETITMGGSLYASAGTSSFAGPITLNSTVVKVDGAELTLSGALSGSSELNKSGAGVLILSNNNSGYTGPVTVTSGKLAITNSNALGNTTATIAVNSGAILDLRNINYTTAKNITLSGGTLLASAGSNSWTGRVTSAGTGATINVSGTNLTINGQIAGAASFTKLGDGLLTFASGTSFYTGSTIIKEGTLAVNSSAGFASSASISVLPNANKTAVLNLSSLNSLANSNQITLDSSASNSAAQLTIGSTTLTNNFSLNGSSNIININSGIANLNGTINGASLGVGSLVLQGAGTINLGGIVGGGNALAALTTNAATTLGMNSTGISTVGSQSYNGPISLGANTILTVSTGNISVNNISAAISKNLTLTASAVANHTFTLAGIVSNLGTLTINGNTGTDSLQMTGSAQQDWNISNSNGGSVTLAGVNTLNFSSMENLVGGLGQDNFIFSNNSVINSVNGGGGNNTLNYSGYSNPIGIILTSDNAGSVQNNLNVGINDFTNINNLIGIGESSIQLANKDNTIHITGGGVGYINDPINFTQFTRFIGLADNNNQVIFDMTPSLANSTTGIAIVAGITLQFTNITIPNVVQNSQNSITATSTVPVSQSISSPGAVQAVVTQQANQVIAASISIINNVNETIQTNQDNKEIMKLESQHISDVLPESLTTALALNKISLQQNTQNLQYQVHIKGNLHSSDNFSICLGDARICGNYNP